MPKKNVYNFEIRKTSKKGDRKTKKGPVVRPGMRIPVVPEQRKTITVILDKLVEVANNSSNLTIREAAKTVEGDIRLALNKQEKYENACRKVLDGIRAFRKFTSLQGTPDKTKKLDIQMDPHILEARIGDIEVAFAELREIDTHKFSRAVIQEAIVTFKHSSQDMINLIEAANGVSNDLTKAVESKIDSEVRGAKILSNFQELSNYIYGNRVRTIGQTEENYNQITEECKNILNQLQESYNQVLGERNAATRTIEENNRRINQQEGELNVIRNQYNQAIAEINTLKDGEAALTQRMNGLIDIQRFFDGLCNHFNVEYHNATELIDGMISAAQEERDGYKRQIELNSANYETQLKKLKENLEEVQGKLDLSNDRITNLRAEYEQKLSKFKTESEVAEREALELRGQISLLQNNVRNLTTERDSLQEQLSAKENELKEKQLIIDTKTNEIEALKRAKLKAEATAADYKQINDQNLETGKTYIVAIKEKTAGIAKLEQELANSKLEFENKEKILRQEFQSQLSKIQNDLNTANKELDAYKKALKQARQERDEAILEKGTEKIAREITEIDVRKLQKEVDDLTKERDKLKKERDKARKEGKEVGEVANEALNQLEDAVNNINRKNEENEKLKKQIVQIPSQIVVKNDLDDSIIEENKLLRKLVSDYEVKLKNLENRPSVATTMPNFSQIEEDLVTIQTLTVSQPNGVPSQATMLSDLVKGASQPNGEIARTIAVTQTLEAAGGSFLANSLAPPIKKVKSEPSIASSLGSFARSLFAAIANDPDDGGDDMDIEEFEADFPVPGNEVEILRVVNRVWENLGYRAYMDNESRKRSRDSRISFTSSTSVAGFIVGHAPDWNLQPNETIFNFWNDFYNTTKPFSL